MPTREIPREQWPTFFNDFSRTRTGARVSVEIVDSPQADPRFSARRLPLVGIGYDPGGGGAGSIEIRAGTEAADQVTHAIAQPVHVYHKDGAGLISEEVNEHEILEITAAEAPRITFLRFERADT